MGERGESAREPAYDAPSCARAVVVLGAAIRWDVGADGARQLGGAAWRRARAAAEAYFAIASAGEPVLVVATGGRVWEGIPEASALRAALVAEGVPEARIARELCSMSTRENAIFTASLLALRGITRATIVTCAWHLPRALAHFARAGIDVSGVGVETPRASVATRVHRWGHELVAARLDGLGSGWKAFK